MFGLAKGCLIQSNLSCNFFPQIFKHFDNQVYGHDDNCSYLKKKYFWPYLWKQLALNDVQYLISIDLRYFLMLVDVILC